MVSMQELEAARRAIWPGPPHPALARIREIRALLVLGGCAAVYAHVLFEQDPAQPPLIVLVCWWLLVLAAFTLSMPPNCGRATRALVRLIGDVTLLAVLLLALFDGLCVWQQNSYGRFDAARLELLRLALNVGAASMLIASLVLAAGVWRQWPLLPSSRHRVHPDGFSAPFNGVISSTLVQIPADGVAERTYRGRFTVTPGDTGSIMALRLDDPRFVGSLRLRHTPGSHA